jgi:hypothetical protein
MTAGKVTVGEKFNRKKLTGKGAIVVSAAKTFADEVRRGVFPESSAARRALAHISAEK